MPRLILPPAPMSNDPNLYRDEYSRLGDVRRTYTGPSSLPRFVETPNLGGHNTGDAPVSAVANRQSPLMRSNTMLSPNTGTISNTYPAAQQNPVQMKAGQDYERMMQMYQGLLNRTPGSSVRERLKPIQAESYEYSEDPRLGGSIRNLEELSLTGGYSPDDIANLRERGISPIRAVYANAQRNLERQKNIAGGYAPNLGAVSAKMAREMSDLISDKTGKVNADIAERVAEGKLKITPQLTDILSRLTSEKNLFGLKNVEARNRAEEINRENLLKEQGLDLTQGRDEVNQILESLAGMQRLFGQGQETGLRQEELKQRKEETGQKGGLALIDSYLRGITRRG